MHLWWVIISYACIYLWVVGLPSRVINVVWNYLVILINRTFHRFWLRHATNILIFLNVNRRGFWILFDTWIMEEFKYYVVGGIRFITLIYFQMYVNYMAFNLLPKLLLISRCKDLEAKRIKLFDNKFQLSVLWVSEYYITKYK